MPCFSYFNTPTFQWDRAYLTVFGQRDTSAREAELIRNPKLWLDDIRKQVNHTCISWENVMLLSIINGHQAIYSLNRKISWSLEAASLYIKISISH